MTRIDPKDNQPNSSGKARNERMYIHATWAAPGTGGGHPKLSGGFEIDKRTGLPCPRSFNRQDQRYTQPQSTILANRASRAAAEYAASAVLVGAEGRWEIRPASGNNYDVDGTLLHCDCPDWWRIDESGYGIVRCKHIYLVMLAIADHSLPFGPNWSCAKWAESAGCTERTAESLCQNGDIPAVKFNGVWLISPDSGIFTAGLFVDKTWPNYL